MLLVGVFALWMISAAVIFGISGLLIVIPALLLSGFYLMRVVLMMIGLLKGPILKQFEKYGDDEPFYYPLPELFFWMGSSVIFGSLWFSNFTSVWFPGEMVGNIMLLLAFLSYRFSEFVKAHPHELLVYPRWLYDLHDRTSRRERRRIAYMWLRLSWKSRLTLNSSDRAFSEWADLIILATLM